MPTGEGGSKSVECCRNLSRLEKLLVCILSIAILVTVVLIVLIFKEKPKSESPSDVCDTTTCLHEAAKILQAIDPSVDPCEDIYQFACGNFLKNAHGDEKFNKGDKMKEQKTRELLEMYAEDIRDNEHKIVKAVKHLFRKCVNETEIEKDNLRTIKGALKSAGGWPVLEGSHWDEKKFDWVNATYKLRQLGYPYSIFLDLQIADKDELKHSFKLTSAEDMEEELPARGDFQYVNAMAEIAIMFEAVGFKDEVLKEMEAAYLFGKSVKGYNSWDTNRETVDEFQQKYGTSFNWLQFINHIATPAAQISKDDFVYFEAAEHLKQIIQTISNTPKRTQANFMMWKVIEKSLPYLTNNLRDFKTSKNQAKTRAEFCLAEIEERFIPTPIEIMHSRKYLPVEKREQVEEIMHNIKNEFVELLKKANWMEWKDKKMTVQKAKEIAIKVGQPEDYFDDKIFNDLDVDMVESKSDTFLSLLAQANRNYQTRTYNRIEKLASENLFERWYIKYQHDSPIYGEEDNLIFIPTIATEGFMYDQKKPDYLNYGFFGYSFGSLLQLFGSDFGVHKNDWSSKTKEARKEKLQCLEEQTDLNQDNFEIDIIELQNVGEQISYAAYEKLTKEKGEQQKLIGVDYTPRQLFWISSTYCHAANRYSHTSKYFEDLTIFAKMNRGARRNNPNFAKDFNCPLESEMNPSKKCTIL